MHNPTTQTINATQHFELAQIIKQFSLPTIEHDPYSLFTTTAPTPLLHYTKGKHVFYIATLSKSLAVLLGAAFMVLPQSTLSYSMRCLFTVEPTLLIGIAALDQRRYCSEIACRDSTRSTCTSNIDLCSLVNSPTQLSTNQHDLHSWLTLLDDFDMPQFLTKLALAHIAVAEEHVFMHHLTGNNHIVQLLIKLYFEPQKTTNSHFAAI